MNDTSNVKVHIRTRSGNYLVIFANHKWSLEAPQSCGYSLEESCLTGTCMYPQIRSSIDNYKLITTKCIGLKIDPRIRHNISFFCKFKKRKLSITGQWNGH